MLRLGGEKSKYKDLALLNSTRGEAQAILLDLGITKDLNEPQLMIQHLVSTGALVELGGGLYHISDEAAR